MAQIKIEFIKTEVNYNWGIKHSEDTVVRPSQTFSSMDEAWSYALTHGANPFKNIRMYNA